MNILLLKPLVVMVIALLLGGIIATTSPTKQTDSNSVAGDMQSERVKLNAFIDQAKAQARKEFNAVAARYHSAETRIKADTSGLVHANNTVQKSATYYGMDVSHYQGNLLDDIRALHNLHFFIVKATQGETEVDPMFTKNWQWLKQSHRIRGAYHFYTAQDNPVKQAKHFIATVGDWQPDDIAPVVDIEAAGMNQATTPEQLHHDLLRFLHIVESVTHKRPIIYSNTAFAQQWLNNAEFARYGLWLADYTSAVKPDVPDPWQATGALIWQKSDSYKVGSTDVDFDEFHGVLTELAQANQSGSSVQLSGSE